MLLAAPQHLSHLHRLLMIGPLSQALLHFLTLNRIRDLVTQEWNHNQGRNNTKEWKLTRDRSNTHTNRTLTLPVGLNSISTSIHLLNISQPTLVRVTVLSPANQGPFTTHLLSSFP